MNVNVRLSEYLEEFGSLVRDPDYRDHIHPAFLKVLDPEDTHKRRENLHEALSLLEKKLRNHITNVPSASLVRLMDEYETTSGTLLGNHRLHFFHVFYVFCLGLALYARNRTIRETIDEHLRREYASAPPRPGFDIGTEQVWLFLFEWSLASLFHDVAYAFELSVKAINHFLRTALEAKGKGSFFALSFDSLDPLNLLRDLRVEQDGSLRELHGHSDQALDLVAWNLSRTIGPCDRETMRHALEGYIRDGLANGLIDHGVYGPLILLRRINDAYFAEGSYPATFYRSVVNAASAAILHNSYQFFFRKPPFLLPPLKLSRHPLGWLLILCDHLQEWAKFESKEAPSISPKHEAIELRRYSLLIDDSQLLLRLPPTKLNRKKTDFPGDLYREIAGIIDLRFTDAQKRLPFEVRLRDNVPLYLERLRDRVFSDRERLPGHGRMRSARCLGALQAAPPRFSDLTACLWQEAEKCALDPDPGARVVATRLLGSLEFFPDYAEDQASRILPWLRRLVKDPDADVWQQAVIALEKLCVSPTIREYRDKGAELDFGFPGKDQEERKKVGWQRRKHMALAERIHEAIEESDPVLVETERFLRNEREVHTLRSLASTFPYLYENRFGREPLLYWMHDLIRRSRTRGKEALLAQVLQAGRDLLASFPCEDGRGPAKKQEQRFRSELLRLVSGFQEGPGEQFSADPEVVHAMGGLLGELLRTADFTSDAKLVEVWNQCKKYLLPDGERPGALFESLRQNPRHASVLVYLAPLAPVLAQTPRRADKKKRKEWTDFFAAILSPKQFDALPFHAQCQIGRLAWRVWRQPENPFGPDAGKLFEASCRRSRPGREVLRWCLLNEALQEAVTSHNDSAQGRPTEQWGELLVKAGREIQTRQAGEALGRLGESIDRLDMRSDLDSILALGEELQKGDQAAWSDLVDMADQLASLDPGAPAAVVARRQLEEAETNTMLSAIRGEIARLLQKPSSRLYAAQVRLWARRRAQEEPREALENLTSALAANERLEGIGGAKAIGELFEQLLDSATLRCESEQDEMAFILDAWESVSSVPTQLKEQPKRERQVRKLVRKLPEYLASFGRRERVQNFGRALHGIVEAPFWFVQERGRLPWLKALARLLEVSEPYHEVLALQGVGQGKKHCHDAFNHTIETVEEVDRILEDAGRILPGFLEEIASWYGCGPEKPPEPFASEGQKEGWAMRRRELRLAALLHDLGKASTRTEEGGKVRFLGHEKRSHELAGPILQRLGIENASSRDRVLNVILNHMKLLHLFANLPRERYRPDDPSIASLARKVGGMNRALDRAVLFLADHRATVGSDSDDTLAIELASSFLEAVRDAEREAKLPPPLLSGEELKRELGLSEGRRLGEVLKRVREEQLAGQLKNRAEAVQLAKRLCSSLGSGASPIP